MSIRIKKGFTIAEILISIFISMVSILAVFYAYNVYTEKVLIKKEAKNLITASRNVKSAYSIHEKYYRRDLSRNRTDFFPKEMVENGKVRTTLRSGSRVNPYISATTYPPGRGNSVSEGDMYMFVYNNLSPKYCLGFIKEIEPEFQFIQGQGVFIKSNDKKFDIGLAARVCKGGFRGGSAPDFVFANY